MKREGNQSTLMIITFESRCLWPVLDLTQVPFLGSRMQRARLQRLAAFPHNIVDLTFSNIALAIMIAANWTLSCTKRTSKYHNLPAVHQFNVTCCDPQ